MRTTKSKKPITVVSVCVSMMIPSAPAAIYVRPIVSIIAGWPPVTPLP